MSREVSRIVGPWHLRIELSWKLPRHSSTCGYLPRGDNDEPGNKAGYVPPGVEGKQFVNQDNSIKLFYGASEVSQPGSFRLLPFPFAPCFSWFVVAALLSLIIAIGNPKDRPVEALTNPPPDLRRFPWSKSPLVQPEVGACACARQRGTPPTYKRQAVALARPR